ncbi:MAG: GNAT family N-acetyltransferase [Planctomycetota bacterium]|jgi:GNAT superfamily N-acetyltransferase
MSEPSIQIRRMTEDDIPLGMRLKNQAGWNQSEESWRRFLSISPEGCFVADTGERGLATVMVFDFGPVAWIAMMLVEESYRGRGLGSRMMTHALDWCDRRGVKTVRLDATPMGQPVYEKLGFVPEYPLARFERDATEIAPLIIPAENLEAPDSLTPIIDLDRAAVGYDRSPMLRALSDQAPRAFRLIRGAGYATLYRGSGATHIGPVIATNSDAGIALLDDALYRAANRRVFIDLALDNTPAVDWATRRGFTRQRDLTRMRRGRPVTDNPRQFFATSGPEKG